MNIEHLLKIFDFSAKLQCFIIISNHYSLFVSRYFFNFIIIDFVVNLNPPFFLLLSNSPLFWRGVGVEVFCKMTSS